MSAPAAEGIKIVSSTLEIISFYDFECGFLPEQQNSTPQKAGGIKKSVIFATNLSFNNNNSKTKPHGNKGQDFCPLHGFIRTRAKAAWPMAMPAIVVNVVRAGDGAKGRYHLHGWSARLRLS
jgi:hypothetical protein